MKKILWEELDCRDVARALGIKLKGDRSKAVWRNGDREDTVAYNKNGWKDFGTDEKGGALQLVMRCNNMDKEQAIEWITENFPECVEETHEKATRNGTKNNNNNESREKYIPRYKRLLDAGYRKTKEYIYTNKVGTPVHIVERWECEGKPKEFLQRKAHGGYGLKGITTYLYNLPDWLNSDYVFLCEGEKDVETLKKYKCKATTNPMGACNWHYSYNEYFKDKKVTICIDNDDAGEKRAKMLIKQLSNVAEKIRIIRFPELQKHGDVTDYINEYGIKKFKEKVKNIPYLTVEELEFEINIVEQQNGIKIIPVNYDIVEINTGNGIKEKRIPVTIETAEKRLFLNIVKEKIFKINENLYYCNENCINEIENAELFIPVLQILRKDKNVYFSIKNSGDFITKTELFKHIKNNSIYIKTYKSFSHLPHYPTDENIFYTHEVKKLGNVKRKNKTPSFDELIEMFNPEDEVSEFFIRCMFISPLCSNIKPGGRPAFVIDSTGGQGTGKTTLAETVCKLYKNAFIKQSTVSGYDKNFIEEMKRKLLSEEGINARILFIDNLTERMSGGEWADFITAEEIHGRLLFHSKNSKRKNDIQVIITSNSAEFKTDMIERIYPLFLKRAKFKINADYIDSFINENREKLFEEFTYILKTVIPEELLNKYFGRMYSFENQVVKKVYEFYNYSFTYCELEETMDTYKDGMNIDNVNALEIKDIFINTFQKLGLNPEADTIFIRSEAIKKIAEEYNIKGNFSKTLREYARRGLLTELSKDIDAFPYKGNNKRRGIFWNKNKKNWNEKMKYVPVVYVDYEHKKLSIKELTSSGAEETNDNTLYQKRSRQRNRKIIQKTK